MKKGATILGIILVIAGLATVVFIAFMFLIQFTLMEYIPQTEQYMLGIILAAILIVIGILIMFE